MTSKIITTMVDYLAKFTGAINRSLLSKLEDVVSIKDFGAVGDWDGTTGTDNTSSIQAAINHLASLGTNAKKVLLIPYGRYRFTTLSFPPTSSGMTIVGMGWRGSQLISSKSDAGPIFQIDTIGLMFQDLDIEASATDYSTSAPQSILIQVKRQSVTVADLDVTISRCRLNGAYYLVESWGRGMVLENCIFSNCRYIWNIEWPADGAYLEGTEWHQKKTTGMRRLVMRNCEVHAVAVGAIRNSGANAINANIEMSSVFSEIGDTLLTGMLGEGSHIHGCRVWGATGICLDITGGDRYTVEHCVFMGTLKASEDGATTNLIRLTGTHSTPTFKNLVLANSRQHAFNISTTPSSLVTNGVFDNIDFIDVALDGGAYVPMVFGGSTTAHSADVQNIRLRGTLSTPTYILSVASSSANIKARNIQHMNGTVTPINGSAVDCSIIINGVGLQPRRLRAGTGSPEGVIDGVASDIWLASGGGAGTTLYVKQTNSGNTGWSGK